MIRLKDGSLNFLQAMNLGCTSNGVRLENINNETNKKVIDNDSKNGYVIVSPCCGYEQSGIEPCGEDAKLALSDFNMKRIAEVMTTCKENKFRYMPIFGRLTQNNEEWYEAAFIIYPYWTNDKPHTFDELQTFAIGLAKRFNQGTILIKRPGEKPVYVTKEGNTECEIGEERDAISDLTEHYFTDLHKHNTNATSVYAGAYINPRPGSLMASHVRFLKGEKFISYP